MLRRNYLHSRHRNVCGGFFFVARLDRRQDFFFISHVSTRRRHVRCWTCMRGEEIFRLVSVYVSHQHSWEGAFPIDWVPLHDTNKEHTKDSDVIEAISWKAGNITSPQSWKFARGSQTFTVNKCSLVLASNWGYTFEIRVWTWARRSASTIRFNF